ncbi:MAG: hypothetical protein HYX55_00770 [Chloroflexi bacterium]|nr:hypothetical protein [Chloroflexota bacterium]
MSEIAYRRPPTAIAIAASIVLIVASCGPGASPAPSPSTTASRTTPPATPPPTPTPTPTPAALEPITPTSGKALVRLEMGASETGSTLALVLYDDGSLVDLATWPPSVRSLTEAGRDLVVGRVRDTGSFTKSHTIPAQPVAHGFGLFAVTLVVDGAPVTVRGTNITCDSDAPPVDCKDDPETRVMLALVDALVDVTTWLPPSAFRDGHTGRHPYLAAKARVTSERIALRPDDWTNPEQSLSLVNWPLETVPSDLGQPVQLASQPDRTPRCGLIDGTRERAVRAALARLGSQSLENDPWTTIWDIWSDGPALLRLTLRPYLPDEAASCEESTLPAAPTLDGAPRPTLAGVLAASEGGIGPVQPASDLYVSIHRTADAGVVAQVSYYADGTVLFRDPSPPAVGLGALRLTPSGLSQLRQALDDSGLLTADYDEPIPEGAAYDHMTTIITPDVVLNASDRGRVAKATAIARLGAKLVDPASWLPRTAWTTDPSRLLPFRPVSLKYAVEPTTVSNDLVLTPVTAVDWPAGSSPAVRLANMTTQDAIALIAAIETTGAPRSGGPTSVEYLLATDVPGNALRVRVWVELNEWGR